MHVLASAINFRLLYSFQFVSTAFKIRLNNIHNWSSKLNINTINNLLNLPKLAQMEDILAPFRQQVQIQGDIVRRLKVEKAPELEIKRAVTELKSRKKLLEDKEIEITSYESKFDRLKFDDLLKQKFFFDQSFSIYGGVQGLFDYGPTGCAIKANILSAWRQFFVLEENLLEVECSMLTPENVLKASGHVERFTDLMVKDSKNGECFRVDHLIETALELKRSQKNTSSEEKKDIDKIVSQLDNLGSDELSAIIKKYNIKSPLTSNDLSEPQVFNLMFGTSIGPTGQYQGYLRPETAQGIFVNFKRLLQFNQGRLPFGAAQIGPAFRNEISPRAGIIRVREFTMAEIEYFCDPSDKSHPRFKEYEDIKLRLISACDQMNGKSAKDIKLKDAVAQGIIANETLGYFMCRIFLFLYMLGVNPNKFRFRQHMNNEMAHYACDCWDAECQTSYGWIECVGCADRSCYDLNQHSKATGTRLVAEKKLSAPVVKRTFQCIPNKGTIGKTFRNGAAELVQALTDLNFTQLTELNEQLSKSGTSDFSFNGKTVKLSSDMVVIKDSEEKLFVEEIVPSVIEPSFGIGRIMYAILEHNFNIRDNDEQRTFLSLPPIIAPYKCSILPLSNQVEFLPFVRQLSTDLTRVGISHRLDESAGSIGRRYARMDQIAIPYGITIDFDTVQQGPPPSATLRERDSMKQIRVPIDELPDLVSDLSNGIVSWNDAISNYPVFEQQEATK